MPNRVIPVAEFGLPKGMSYVDQVLAYPYIRPNYSFITDGSTLVEIPTDLDEFRKEANYFLGEAGVPALDKRIPVIGYGANSNPVLFSDKMSDYGGKDTADERQIAPHLLATVPGAINAWHGSPGQSGNIYAELYRDDATKYDAAVVHIAFLTRLQVAIMHTSENARYRFGQVDVITADSNEVVRAFGYLSKNSSVLMNGRRPVAVQRTGEEAVPGSMTGHAALDFMLSQLPTQSGAEPVTARGLIRELNGKSLKDRKARQEAIATKLLDLGVARKFSFPTLEAGYMGRADMNFSGFGVSLMEEILKPLRPRNPIHLLKSQDLTVKIRQTAHDELADDLITTVAV